MPNGRPKIWRSVDTSSEDDDDDEGDGEDNHNDNEEDQKSFLGVWWTFEYIKAEECMNAFFWSWIQSFRWYLDKIRRLYILISFCFVTAIRYETDLKMLLEYRDYPSIPHPKAPPQNAKKLWIRIK